MPLGNTNNALKSQVPHLLTKEIQDLYLRQNFQQLVNYFAQQNQLVTFNFFELNITAPITTAAVLAHNLGYLPKDIIITQITGTGAIEFLYGSFTTTTISYLATGPCRVRFFVGTYFGDSSSVSAQNSDIQSVLANPLSESSLGVVSVTGAYKMTGAEFLVKAATVSLNGTNQAIITLPPGVAGVPARVQKTDANSHPVSIVPLTPASQTIIPEPLLTLTIQWQTAELVYDGTNWCLYNKWGGT